MKNILESFLDALEVRYTKRYVRRLYEEHPHRGNMYGLKQIGSASCRERVCQ